MITDPHPTAGIVGGQAFYGGIVPGRPMTWMRNHYHAASTWLRAFRTAGLLVEDCIEPPWDGHRSSRHPRLRVPRRHQYRCRGAAGHVGVGAPTGVSRGPIHGLGDVASDPWLT